jgi:hypothetical protein
MRTAWWGRLDGDEPAWWERLDEDGLVVVSRLDDVVDTYKYD